MNFLLPRDVLQQLLLLVPTEWLCSTARTCKLWSCLIKDDNFWKAKVGKKLLDEGLSSAKAADEKHLLPSWLELFKQMFLLTWEREAREGVILLEGNPRFVSIFDTRKTVLANTVYTKGKHSWEIVTHKQFSNGSWIGVADPTKINRHNHLNCPEQGGYSVGASADYLVWKLDDRVRCDLDMDRRIFFASVRGRKICCHTNLPEKISPAVSNNMLPTHFSIRWISAANQMSELEPPHYIATPSEYR